MVFASCPSAVTGPRAYARRGLFLCLLASAALLAGAQVPVALPNSISTVAGGGAAITVGSPCSAGSAYTATDTFGDGCPATAVALGTDEWGIGTDNFGNVYMLDDSNVVIHRIDARSGLLTLVAGGGTVCASKLSTLGDGCIAATQTAGFNSRNMSTGPWGNVILPDYGHGLVHIICNTVSPLCTAAQVGYMLPVAGYISAAGAVGNSSGVSGTTAGTAGDGTLAVSTVTTTGVAGPRGGTADIYGNVYIADTANNRFRIVLGPASYKGVANPLLSIMALDSTYPSPSAGFIYPLLGGFTVPTKGAFCTGSSGPVALDAYGDGCPFFQSAEGSAPYGVTTDASGNAVFVDSTNKLIRVLYVGGTKMAALITLENPTVTTPVAGSVYLLAGGGASGVSATAALGTSLTLGNPYSVAVDPAGNIYAGEKTNDVVFLDINTGYARRLFVSGTSCNSTANGDGCPVNSAAYSYGSYTLPIAFDGLGNLYMADQSHSSIREVSASSLIPATIGTTATQTLLVHEPAGVTGISATLTAPSPDVNLGSLSCAANADTTLDCSIVANLTPSAPGLRSAALSVTASGSSTATTIFPLSGIVTGSALVTDNTVSTTAGASPVSTPAAPAPTTLGSIVPLAVSVDGSGNVYSVDAATSKFSVYVPGQGSGLLALTAPSGLGQLATDTQGDIYAVGSGATTITKLTVTGPQVVVASPASYTPPSYSSSTIAYTPATTPAKPQGVAVDAEDNLYVSDGTNGSVYKISQSDALQPLVTVASGLTNPTLLALDAANNLYVYDAGATTLYKYTAAGVKSTFLASVAATGLTTDAALDVYVQTATGVTEYPVTGATTPVYSGGKTPAGIALDGSGNLYIADGGNAGVLQVIRSGLSFNFGTGSANSPTLSGAFSNIGNQNATGGNPANTSVSFNLLAGASNGCTFTSSTLGAQATGNACTFTANLVGSGSGTPTDIVSYLPASTLGSLTLTGTLTGTSIATTTTIGGQTPANPIYSATGTEVSFAVTVAPASGTTAPAGTVAVTVDSATTYPALVASGSNGVATVTLTGLTAGMHVISATFSTSGSFTGSSTATSTSFVIAPASSSTTWTPSATTQSFSAPLGNAVLNAAATVYGGGTVPGSYVYTATPSGGSPQEVHAASYLPIGTYALGVTFYPNDSTDYATSTASVGTYTVVQAATTAPIGGTQALVASDGTGNYTAVQPAVDALGVNGGSIYIKPGTYTGDITVVQPNVALRGLGGDPTKVILTHAGGSFNNGQVQNQYAGEFNVSQNNGSQLTAGSTVFNGDEASATLVVARSIDAAVSSSTLTPNNFYADYLTLQNTYNTDSTTTTTTEVSGGACTANAGAAQTYQYLYNNGLECASQALAIWITSDTAVLNNVYTTSQQDTIYAAAISGGTYPARQYWFRGKITGDVDFIFGDAAAVFDHTSIYTTWHGNSATGTETIEAQNASIQNGTNSTYYSGYIMNSDIFTSQSPGMTNLDFGRPYGAYSTWIMLNSAVDQVSSTGYIPFSGSNPLTDATYGEYNDSTYTDPATNAADANGVLYLGSGGNSGSGVLPTSARESASIDPGYTAFSANATNAVGITQPQAQQFYPLAFLGRTIPTNTYNTVATWDPTAAIAADANAFVPSTSPSSINAGQSITLLMRPQTPGLGAVTNGVYTIPTGTYTLYDNSTQIASGSLDASGEATYTSSALAGGTHSFTWTYSGDSNFQGSSTSTAYALNVIVPKVNATVSLSGTTPITYGTTEAVTVTVSGTSGTPTGTVSLSLGGDPVANGQTIALNGSGQATINVAGLTVGSNNFSATYSGSGSYNSGATVSNFTVAVNPYPLSITASCTNRAFYAASSCSVSVPALVNGDTTATVFSAVPTIAANSALNSPAATYTPTTSYTLTTYGSTNYAVTVPTVTYTVTGSSSAAQVISFAPLPNFVSGSSYQLSATSSSGLPVTYAVTSGNATIAPGSTVLQVTGAGPVTVTASCTDSANDYAAATPVARSFTAQ